MTIKSNARFRGFIGQEGDATEVRFFLRPSGDYTRAEYADDDTPDNQMLNPSTLISAAHAALLIKLTISKNIDDI